MSSTTLKNLRHGATETLCALLCLSVGAGLLTLAIRRGQWQDHSAVGKPQIHGA